jgi:hypothetical protein
MHSKFGVLTVSLGIGPWVMFHGRAAQAPHSPSFLQTLFTEAALFACKI